MALAVATAQITNFRPRHPGLTGLPECCGDHIFSSPGDNDAEEIMPEGAPRQSGLFRRAALRGELGGPSALLPYQESRQQAGFSLRKALVGIFPDCTSVSGHYRAGDFSSLGDLLPNAYGELAHR